MAAPARTAAARNRAETAALEPAQREGAERQAENAFLHLHIKQSGGKRGFERMRPERILCQQHAAIARVDKQMPARARATVAH